MQLFFGIFYLVFFAGVVITSLFILFHLSRYSLNRGLALGMTTLFLFVTAVLLLSNSVLFFSLPIEEFVSFSRL